VHNIYDYFRSYNIGSIRLGPSTGVTIYEKINYVGKPDFHMTNITCLQKAVSSVVISKIVKINATANITAGRTNFSNFNHTHVAANNSYIPKNTTYLNKKITNVSNSKEINMTLHKQKVNVTAPKNASMNVTSKKVINVTTPKNKSMNTTTKKEITKGALSKNATTHKNIQKKDPTKNQVPRNVSTTKETSITNVTKTNNTISKNATTATAKDITSSMSNRQTTDKVNRTDNKSIPTWLK